MKKRTMHLLSVAALSLLLVACGDKQPTTSTTPPPPEPMTSTPASDPVPPELVGATAPTNADVVPGTLTTTQDAATPSSSAPMDTAPATPVAAPAAGGMAPVSDPAVGKAVYDKSCALCHVAGVAGAPKLTDKADWAPRIAQGNDTLYKHTIEGYTGSKGVHPARGGDSNLSDDELKASVDYMTSQAM